MKNKSFLGIFIFLGLMFCSFVGKSAGCWLFSWSSQQWYYFPTVCCTSFEINWALGDQCYSDPSCVAFSGNGVEERVNEIKNHPSLSSLSKICKYEIKMDGSGNGTIFINEGRVAVLNSKGLHDFFSTGTCFYASNEVKMQVIDGNLVPIDANRPLPNIKVKDETISSNAVPLGNLNSEQVEMIKVISHPLTKELRQEYDLNVVPNPANEQINVLFKSSKDQKAKIRLIHLNGSTLFINEPSVIRGQNSFIFDVKGFNPGTYFILLEIDGVKISQKVIKG